MFVKRRASRAARESLVGCESQVGSWPCERSYRRDGWMGDCVAYLWETVIYDTAIGKVEHSPRSCVPITWSECQDCRRTKSAYGVPCFRVRCKRLLVNLKEAFASGQIFVMFCCFCMYVKIYLPDF